MQANLARFADPGARWLVTRDMLACTQRVPHEEPTVGACVGGDMQDNGFSEGCAGCLGGLGQCSADACRTPCGDPGAADCMSCQQTSCSAGLYACLGEEVPAWFQR